MEKIVSYIDNGEHTIYKDNDKYFIKYANGFTTQGVHELVSAVAILKKKYPNAEEVIDEKIEHGDRVYHENFGYGIVDGDVIKYRQDRFYEVLFEGEEQTRLQLWLDLKKLR